MKEFLVTGDGIQFPKDKDTLELLYLDSEGNLYRKETLPKVEGKIKELSSHGCLCDLDKLKDYVKSYRMERPVRGGAVEIVEIGDLFIQILNDFPTFLEANNG